MKSMRLGLGVALLVSLGVLAPRMLAQPRVVQPKAGPPQVAHYDATPGAGVAALVKQLDAKSPTVRKGAEAKIASCARNYLGKQAKPADKALFKKFNQAERLLLAKLTNVQWSRAVGRSMPPMHSAQLTFVPSEILRGPADKAKKPIQAGYTHRGNRPAFAKGVEILVCLKKTRGRIQVESITPADKKTIEAARIAAALPVGYQFTPKGDAPHIRRAGKGVTLTVKQAEPKVRIKWTNPDGDGEYDLTVTNTNKTPVTVEALRVDPDDKKILWNDSVKIVCQDKACTLPPSGEAAEKTKPLRLKPGQSVTGKVNAFAMRGGQIKWPRGGYRIEFRFAVGELAATESFYYRSKHHDAIRKQAQQNKK